MKDPSCGKHASCILDMTTLGGVTGGGQGAGHIDIVAGAGHGHTALQTDLG